VQTIRAVSERYYSEAALFLQPKELLCSLSRAVTQQIEDYGFQIAGISLRNLQPAILESVQEL
jgi:hypothetical protein